MARTKAQEAKKLAQVAHCMDNHLRTENKQLHEYIKQLKLTHEDELLQQADYALDLVQRTVILNFPILP